MSDRFWARRRDETTDRYCINKGSPVPRNAQRPLIKREAELGIGDLSEIQFAR